MKLKLNFYLLLLCSYSLQAQIEIQNNALATAGNTISNSTLVFDFTLGEVFTTTITNGNQFTQGFQQPWCKKIIIQDPIYVSVNPLTESNFKVYPNPFQNDITIELPENVSVNIHVFDNSGRLIYNDSLSELTNKIDFSQLTVGNYQLIVSESDNQFSGRLSLIKMN